MPTILMPTIEKKHESTLLQFRGAEGFRQRLVLATLSGRSVRISHIRSNAEEAVGLSDYEASFVRLLEKVTNGSLIEINHTGTKQFKCINF